MRGARTLAAGVLLALLAGGAGAQTQPAAVAPAEAPAAPAAAAPAEPGAPEPERIVTGLSQDAVSITTSFTGSEILIFGAIRRDAPPQAGPVGIIVTVEGPSQQVTVRRKERLAGIWINTQSLRIAAAPDFYAVATSGPLPALLDPAEDTRFRISPALAIRALSAEAEVENVTPFTQALLDLRTASGRYRVDEGAVHIVDDTLFRADVRMPSNLVEGDYRARIFLVRDGAVIDYDQAPIRVRKVGLERWLYRLAIEQPFWYGLMSLAIAMAAGWLASAAFRAIRRG